MKRPHKEESHRWLTQAKDEFQDADDFFFTHSIDDLLEMAFDISSDFKKVAQAKKLNSCSHLGPLEHNPIFAFRPGTLVPGFRRHKKVEPLFQIYSVRNPQRKSGVPTPIVAPPPARS